jgi:hemerythrin-like domain-containing protein
MTTTEIRNAAQEAVSAQTSSEHDALVAAMQALERALAAAAPGREASWAQRVAADLRDVRSQIEQHRLSTEAPDGLFQEIRLAMPAAAYRLGKLRQAHGAMLDEVDALLTAVDRIGAGTPGSYDAIRRRAAGFLAGLRAHQAEEVDLIYEAFARDIGAVD